MNTYVIMANGKGVRWDNFTDRPKHLIKIGDETLLARIVRILKTLDPHGKVIITSNDERYEVEGAHRHVPLNNHLEIDRFTEELIGDGVCFLYGDTFYTEKALEKIVASTGEELLFFGNEKRIVAVKVFDGTLMKRHVDKVKTLFLTGVISDCKGWQLYQSYIGGPLDSKAIGDSYTLINDQTQDFNYPEDYLRFLDTLPKSQNRSG